jgi:hypothetical protein
MSPSLLWSDAALAGMFMGPIGVGGIAWYWGYKALRRGVRNPLARNLLRIAGQSRLEKIDDLRWDVAAYMGIGMLPAPIMLAVYLEGWASEGGPPSWPLTLLCLAVFLLFQAWAVGKLLHALAVLRRMRLAHQAEVATGQELNEVARLGYRVFHDLPFDNGRYDVDHVVVGPGGVFVIESKGRAHGAHGAHGGWTLRYDGESLEFPGWEERKPLLQAVALANRAQAWLSLVTGEAVRAHPVLVFPGWNVQRTSAEGITVLGGGELRGYFAGLEPDPKMTDKLVQRVAYELELRCRDLAPIGYPEPDLS